MKQFWDTGMKTKKGKTKCGALFWKIYLQVSLGMVLLAVILTGYLLWKSQQQGMEDIVQYEKERIARECVQMQTNMWHARTAAISDRSSEAQNEAVLYRAVATGAFRRIFLSRGALFEGTEEIFNSSPYTYDIDFLRKNEELLSSYPDMISVSGVQKVNGRRLLLFSQGGITARGQTYSVILYRDVTDIFARTQKVFWQGIAFTSCLLLLCGVFLYAGIARALFPLMELQQAASAIAGGAYESRAQVRGRDEIGALTVSFNQMAEKVEEHMALLTDTNEQQRQLLGSLAHELKTPLTAIIGYADTLLTTCLSEKNRVRALGYIRSEGKRLSRLSEKMLELTGLYESSTQEICLRTVRLEELFRRLEELTVFRLRQKNIRLVCTCIPRDLERSMDADLMMSLLMNLVDNACKASPDRSEIRVIADDHSIVVEDHGKGIPANELGRVTEAFYMVNKSRAKSAGSIGLGLALCSRIARLHEAQLVIESEEGKGTRVSVVW